MADDKKDIDVSNTLIVRGIKHGLSLEEAEKMAYEEAEEEAKSTKGQFIAFFKKNLGKFFIWLGSVLGLIGALIIAYLSKVIESVTIVDKL